MTLPRRLLLIASMLLMSLGFAVAQTDEPKAPTINDLAWLAGSWAGEHDGGTIEEHWAAPKGNSMIGMSRLIIGQRTVFFEFLRIEQRADGSVVYLAQPKGRTPPVEFKATRLTPGEAVFENPEHDNPKLIRYTLKEGVLSAVTEGDEKGARQVHESVMSRGGLTP